MAKIQGPKEGKPILIYTKKNGLNLGPMGSGVYPEVHENPIAFFSSSSTILLKPLAHGSGD